MLIRGQNRFFTASKAVGCKGHVFGPVDLSALRRLTASLAAERFEGWGKFIVLSPGHTWVGHSTSLTDEVSIRRGTRFVKGRKWPVAVAVLAVLLRACIRT